MPVSELGDSNKDCESLRFMREILGFYLPLAATSVLMMVTHSVVSAATARTLYPTVALAAYSASHSVAKVIESPCYAMQRICLTFTQGKTSFRKVKNVTLMILGILVLVQSLATWTTLSKTIFVNLLGVSDEIYRGVIESMQIFVFWPVFSTMRSIYQTPIVMHRKTHYTTLNMLVRVVAMFVAASILPRVLPTGPVGAAILMMGLGVEAVLTFIVSKKAIPPLVDEGPDEPSLGYRGMFAFVVPLVFASIIQTLGGPMITGALSRTGNPATALAAYQVAMSYSLIFNAPTMNIYHVVVIFGTSRERLSQLKLFSVILGIFLTACLALTNFPAVGNWIFGGLIGAPQDIIPEAIRTLRYFSWLPLVASLAEFYGGVLLMQRHAFWVTLVKFLDVFAVFALSMLLVSIFPKLGGSVGAIVMVSGRAVEALVCYLALSRVSGREILDKDN